MPRLHAGPRHLRASHARPGVPALETPAVWMPVLDETVRLCAMHGSPELAEKVERKRAQFLSNELRVLVTGAPRQGKSQLINALLNADVCAPGAATVVRHAEKSMTATVLPGFTEVGVPRALLASGMVLIDAPGDAPLAQLEADVALVVSDASRELVAAEIDLVRRLARIHGKVLVVLTKTDIAPDWRTIAERNRRHLADAGVAAGVIPVSAPLRMQAARANDQAGNAESGFPALLAHLSQPEEAIRASAAVLAQRVIEQLSGPLNAEVSTVDLRDAQRAVEDLRRCNTRWQNVLADEMADLMSDLEYDLRDRTRQILMTVDEAFDSADPVADWDTFAEWLAENLLTAAEVNYEWMFQRCDLISRRVAEPFMAYGYHVDALPHWQVKMPDELPGRLPAMEMPQAEKFTLTQKLFAGMRGSYGGVLIIGLATSLAGLALINPLSVGAGALFGGKAIVDEGRSVRKRRQATAKSAAQRSVDDFFLRFSKECRDTARQIQRVLRDHFTAVTEELQEEIVRSFRRAKYAADALGVERSSQIRELATLYARAQALTRVTLGPAS
ncbi:GTPase [Catelliglobosispora koreensis]|uniref:GTPase n=1 Tax=Catelliglobosispora koreensis TaxID=129052 RepID=UPI00146EA8D8|nr:GTPase [Catelliglobosispora koreensis]